MELPMLIVDALFAICLIVLFFAAMDGIARLLKRAIYG